MSGKRVLVVEWSAAEWSAVHSAIDRDELPHLASLVEGGVSGPLTTLAPLSVPIVAATLATGVHPPHHGVLGEMERRPDGAGVQPVGRRSWRVSAVWEHLARASRTAAVVNWPATQPADLWPGIVIDDSFAASRGRTFDDWPLPPHCITPDRLRAVMGNLRLHPRDVSSSEVKALVPGLLEVDARSDRRPRLLAASLARSATVHAAATYIAEHEDWDLLLVRYPLIADVWRNLAPGDAADKASPYSVAVGNSYRLMDVMLGRLLELAGPDSTIFVIAAAGWRSAGMPMRHDAEDSFAAFDKGLLVARGQGLRQDAIFHRAATVDVTPTLLAYFGLSTPCNGVVLESLFAEKVSSADLVPPPPPPEPTPNDDAALHLLALGYSDTLTKASIDAIATAELARLRNLSEAYLALHQWDEALETLKKILRVAPDDYLANLKSGRVFLLKGESQAALIYANAAMSAAPDSPWSHMLVGSAYAAVGDVPRARPHFESARSLGSNLLGVNLSLGWAAVLLQLWRDAESAFGAALKLNSTVAEAHMGLGISLQAQGAVQDAERELRQAIGLSYDSPMAHFHLGKILFQRGEYMNAVASLQVALSQNAGLVEARKLLGRIQKVSRKPR